MRRPCEAAGVVVAVVAVGPRKGLVPNVRRGFAGIPPRVSRRGATSVSLQKAVLTPHCFSAVMRARFGSEDYNHLAGEVVHL
ncbi:hypothetical protein O3P69_013113 [Scylla paramamosain]|uniref:Uncharacterized protein n=1 Tax=Scylla paramamosain TaxID=85552 RepID=A0AAW0U085_SCYPA